MNNHHDIVYVPDENGDFAVEFMPDEIAAFNQRVCEAKQLKDVFIFTKEELDKRDKEVTDKLKKALQAIAGMTPYFIESLYDAQQIAIGALENFQNK